MAKPKLRIAFIGVGGMGQMAHLRNYATNPDCEISAIAEVRAATGKLVAQRYGISKVYVDHREMLAKEKFDGLVCCQPFSRHAVLLPELFAKTKFLFTEKPLAVGIDAGAKLAAQAQAAGCTHMVGYHKRSDPGTQWAKKKIDELKASGALGKLQYVRILMPAGDWIQNGFTGLIDAGDKPPEAFDHEPPLADLDEATRKQYISFVNYYIHQVNLMRHLLGEPYRVTYAEKSGVLLAIESASGIAGTIEMTPYRTTVDWQESALVAFEKGYLKIDLPAPLVQNRSARVEFYSDPGDKAVPERFEPALPSVHAMRQQAANFLAVIRGEMKPPCDSAEAVEDLKISREYIRLRFGK